MQTCFWQAVSNKSKIATLNSIDPIIGNFGFITDFKQFSDISISLQIEIIDTKLQALYCQLKDCINIEKPKESTIENDKEIILFLHISFKESTGDFRIETPAVPG